MKDLLKGTKTEANLQAAFAGESQARNRYSYFSDMAKSEGYDILAKFFEDTATNEKNHAKVWFKLLHGNIMPHSKENLADAIKGENAESTLMYPTFAAVAREEGFETIAGLFDEVATIEALHEKQCQQILDSLNAGKALEFVSPDISCMDCGHELKSKEGLENCPVCGAGAAFFMQKK